MFDLRNLDRSSVWFFLVATTAILFPWNERATSIGIILLVIHWLFDAKWVDKIKSIRISWGIGFLWGFFFLHLLQLGRTTHWSEAMHTIEVKLVFFILPLLFSTENYLDRKNVRQLLLLFSISCGLSFFYTLGWSFLHFHQQGIGAVLTRMNISGGVMHPGYYANYFAFGLMFLFYELVENKGKVTKDSAWIIGMSIFFLFIEIVLVSKTALLFLGCLLVYVVWYFISFIRDVRARIVAFFLILAFILFASSQIPQISGRITETKQNLVIPNNEVKFANSTKSRMVAWSLEWQLISKKWLIGYGTGNANPVLMKSFIQNDYKDLIKFNMHTHNQVLHTWLDLGIFGVLLLLGWIVFFTKEAIVKSKPFLFWLMVLIFINCLTDDMLEIQAGGVFFIFFLSLFSFHTPRIKGTYH